LSKEIKHLQEQSVREVLAGLKQRQKRISSKFFYDQRGSELFNRICGTDEYYLTRTEEKILKQNRKEMAEVLGSNVLLVEFGSGSSSKTKILLENADITGYIPVDISYEHLMESVRELKDIFPDLKIYPMPADYSSEFILPETDSTFNRTIIFFPGSTIGNFEKEEAREFLKKTRMLKGNCGMIAGFDLVKDKEIIESAYNDSEGVTAEFNLNILDNINNLTGSDFMKENFEHLAFFNEAGSRIEMHLISRKEQVILIGDKKIKIAKGENIITEYSYKYTLDDIRELVKDYYDIKKVWMDRNKYFAVVFLG
jgi:dimethylhistidine N-methyltransferase